MKCHRQSYLSNRTFLFMVVGTISLRVRCGQMWALSGLVSTEASLLGLDIVNLLLVSHMVLTSECQGGTTWPATQ